MPRSFSLLFSSLFLMLAAAGVTGAQDTTAADTAKPADITPPAVTSVSLEPAGTVRAGELRISVVFSEEMKQKVAPRVGFGDRKPFRSVLFKGAWNDGKTWAGSCTVPVKVMNGTHTVSIDLAQDTAGNTVRKYTEKIFVIDTQQPTVSSIDLSAENGLQGSGTVKAIITFDEAMDRKSVLTVGSGLKAPFNNLQFAGTWQNEMQWTGEAAVIAETPNGTHTISVAGGKDAAGNDLETDSKTTFRVDTEGPAVTGITYKPSRTGTGRVDIAVDISEPVNRETPLTVSLGIADPFNTLTATGGWKTATRWEGSVDIAATVPNGHFKIRIAGASDPAGNNMTADTRDGLDVDTKAPVLTKAATGDTGVIMAGTVPVEFIFSEQMDKAAGLKVDAVHDESGATVTAKGGWTGDAVWKGSIVFTGKTENGPYSIAVSGGNDPTGNAMEAYGRPLCRLDSKAPKITGLTWDKQGVLGTGKAALQLTFSEPMNTNEKITVSLGRKAPFKDIAVSGAFENATLWNGELLLTEKAASGSYTLSVSGGKDMAGNGCAAFNAAGIMIDTKAPAVTNVETEPDGVIGLGDCMVTVVFSEPMDAAVPLKVVFGDKGTFSVTGDWTEVRRWHGTVAIGQQHQDGRQPITVSGGRDMAGNILPENKEHVITIDKTPPQVASVTVGDGKPLARGGYPVKIAFSEGMDKLAGLAVTFGPASAPDAFTVTGAWTAADTWEGKISVTATTSDGKNILNIGGAADKAGNPLSVDNSHTFMADPVIPEVISTTLVPEGVTGAGSVKAVFVFSEAMDQTRTPSVTSGAGAFKGAWKDSVTWTGELTVTTDMPNGGQQIVLDGACDRAGNKVAKSKAASFVIDTRAPGVQNASVTIGDGAAVINSRQVSFSFRGFTDAGSGIAGYFWSREDGGGTEKGTPLDAMEGELALEKDGPAAVYVWARDIAGNISKAVRAAVRVDTEAPRVTGVTIDGPELKTAGPVSAVITFSEPLDKRALPVVTFGNGASYALSGKLTADSTMTLSGTIPDDAANGLQRIYVTGGTDRAGNPLVADSSGTFAVDTRRPVCSRVTLDKQSPVTLGEVTVTAVFDEAMDRTKTLSVHISSVENNVTPAMVTGAWQDGKTWQGTCALTADMPGGTQVVAVKGGADAAGNTMEPDRSLTFELDSSPPEVVSVTMMPERVATAGTVSVTVTFSEDLSEAESPAVTCGTAVPYNALKFSGSMTEPSVWQGMLAVTGKTSNGLYTLAVGQGKDRAGNALKPYTGNPFTIDTEAPALTSSMVSLEGGAATTNKRDLSLACSGVSDGEGTGLKTLYYSLADHGGTREGIPFTDEQVSVAAMRDGKFTVYVWAEDKAGNIGFAVSASIVIDATPPSVTAVSAGEPEEREYGGFRVTVIFNEPVNTESMPAVTCGTDAPYDRDGVFRNGAWLNDTTWQAVLAMDSLMSGDRLGLAIRGVRDRTGNEMAEDLTRRIPVSALSYYQYGQYLDAGNHTDAALGALDRCLALRPGFMAAYKLKGSVYLRAGQALKAVEVYRQALRTDPLDPGLYSRLAGLLRQQGMAEEAYRVSRTALRVNRAVTDGPIPYCDLPVTELVPDFIPQTEHDFTLFNTEMAAGLAYAALGDQRAAEDRFAQAVKLNDESARAHYNLGRARYATGDVQAAVPELYQALGQDSTLQEAALLLGVIAAGQDSVEEAETQYRAVTRKDLAWLARANTAVLKARSGDTDGAVGMFEAVYRDHPDGRVAYNLGIVQQAGGQTDRAYTLFEKAGQDHALAACRRGVILYGRGQSGKAVGELVHALTLEPALAEAAYTLGRISQEQDYLQEAELWYQRAVVFDPSHMEAYANLGIIYGRLGMTNKEKASYAKAQSLRKKRRSVKRKKDAETRPVAVASFDNTSGNAAYDWLKIGIAEALTSDLKELADLNLVERLKVEKTMQELALASTDLMAEKAGEMGKLTGAQLIISGGFQMVDNQIKIDARLIDVATGEVKSATSARGLLDSIFAVQRSLAVNLLRDMGIQGGSEGAAAGRHARSLDALRYLSEGRTSFYKGDTEASLEKMRKAAELDDQFRDALVDMELESAADKTQRTLAVMSFGNSSGDEKAGWIGDGIAEALTTDLRKVTGLFLVERLALNQALNELQLGKTDIVEEKSAPRIGKMVGAGAVIMGSYQVAAENIRIDARMVEVAGGKILMTETVQGQVEDLYALEEQLAFKIADVLNISVSIAEREQMSRAADPRAQALRNVALSQTGTAEELPTEEADKTMALVPFRNNCGADARRYGWLEKSIQDVMTTEFSQSGLVRLVDRQVMKVQIGEEALAGLVGMDDLDASMQKLIPADFLLQGGFQVAGDNIRIDSRLVDVETGAVLFTESSHGNKDDILGVQLDLAGKILGSIRKSARGKTGGGGAVKLAGDDRYKIPMVWVAGGTGVTALLGTISHFLYRSAADDYAAATTSGFDETHDRAERYLQTRNFLIGTMVTTAGASYVWNKFLRTRFKRLVHRGPALVADGTVEAE